MYGTITDDIMLQDENIYTANEIDFNIIVILDYNNKTYAVVPKKEEGIEKKPVSSSPIEDNKNNKFNIINVTDEQMAINYFNIYKKYIVRDLQELYNNLENDYKEKRFTQFNEFETYIENKKEDLLSTTLTKWQIKNYEDYTQYVCMDDKGRYYIFRETSPMQYTLLLDTYTIDIPEFIEKYDSCNVQERVVLNIEKIKQALNSGDYRYVYSKLADSFKNNKYKTEQEFENYIKGALYNNIDIEYKNFSNEGETYIYDVEIKNLENEEDTIISMQIIMQLKEDRDFVMSFSIK